MNGRWAPWLGVMMAACVVDRSGALDDDAGGSVDATSTWEAGDTGTRADPLDADAPIEPLRARLVITPETLDLGDVFRGDEAAGTLRVTNLGETVASVAAVVLTGAQPFELELRSADPRRAPDRLQDPDADGRAGLSPGAWFDVTVRFRPADEGEARATLHVLSDVGGADATLSARSVPNACPRAVVPEPRIHVEVGTAVRLDGAGSRDPDGPRGQAALFEWRLVDPLAALLGEALIDAREPRLGVVPDDPATPTAILVALSQQDYVVELRVREAHGLGPEACPSAVARVVVEARYRDEIGVELTWTSPNDPTLGDRDGTDLDLHLLHPNADGWFSPIYDCYVNSPRPDWGTLNVERDNPELRVAPAGPLERIDLPAPENTDVLGAPYVAGVHYVSSVGRSGVDFGPSFARVRIFLGGELTWDSSGRGEAGSGSPDGGARVMEATDHFWDVAEIHWPSARVVERDRYYGLRP